MKGVRAVKVYDCEICGAYHPWEWDGDCRDDAARVDLDTETDGTIVLDARTMDERMDADLGYADATV